MEIGGPGWRTVTEVDSRMSCDDKAFYVETRLTTRDDDAPFFERRWSGRRRGSSVEARRGRLLPQARAFRKARHSTMTQEAESDDVVLDHVTKRYGDLSR